MKEEIAMYTLRAYIATLGGGCFLTRKLNTAIGLARAQMHFSLLQGDVASANRCLINEAYNYIHLGFFDKALFIIRKVLKNAKKDEDFELVAIARSARLFCKRVRQAAAQDVGQDETTDELYRVRIFKKGEGKKS
jgi:hypothetical protein